MKTKTQLIKEKEKIELQIKELEQKEEQEEFQLINYKNKEFRIYKWENKPVRDFVYPKGFKLIEYSEFIDLFDNKIIDYPKENWEVYFTKHYSKRKQKENILSGFYLNYIGILDVGDDNLASSDGNGRVVLVWNLKC